MGRQKRFDEATQQWVDISPSAEEFDAHLSDNVHHVPYGVATGTANTYAVTLDSAPTAYVEGMAVSVKINVNATGVSTLNVNGLGAKGIKKSNGTDVTNLKSNGIYTFRYDGVNFILQGEGGSGNATASDLLSGKTASTDAGDIVGTMPNRGTFNLGFGQSVPAGYYSGGTVPSGKKYAKGSVSNIDGVNQTLQVSGLSFRPSVVIVYNGRYTSNNGYSGYAVYGENISAYATLNGKVKGGASPSVVAGNFTINLDGFSVNVYDGLGALGYCGWIAFE